MSWKTGSWSSVSCVRPGSTAAATTWRKKVKHLNDSTLFFSFFSSKKDSFWNCFWILSRRRENWWRFLPLISLHWEVMILFRFLLADVPVYYVCDFCRTPKAVRFSQRNICHDLPYIRSGRLAEFFPIEEDVEELTSPSSSSLLPILPPPSGFYQSVNRPLYRELAADTIACNDQLKMLKKLGRALIAAEECEAKSSLLLSGICKTQRERVKLCNLIQSLPEDVVRGQNLSETLKKLSLLTAAALDAEIPLALPVITTDGVEGMGKVFFFFKFKIPINPWNKSMKMKGPIVNFEKNVSFVESDSVFVLEKISKLTPKILTRLHFTILFYGWLIY